MEPPALANTTKIPATEKSSNKLVLGRGTSTDEKHQEEEILTRLIDGLSEISQCGIEQQDSRPNRANNFCDTPVISSPITSPDLRKEITAAANKGQFESNMIGQDTVKLSSLKPSLNNNATSHHNRNRASLDLMQGKSKMPQMHLSIKKNILKDYRPAPTSSEVRSSANKKITFGGQLSPEYSIVSDRPPQRTTANQQQSAFSGRENNNAAN